MSRLLKAAEVFIAGTRKTLEEPAILAAGANRVIRTSEGQFAESQTGPDSEMLQRRIAELELADTERTREFEALELAAFQRGMDEGVKVGMTNVRRDHENQMDALRTGVQDALDGFRQQLRDVETLALDLTQVALEKIFGDPALRSTLVAQTTRHHLSRVAANSAIGVRVSAADFSDPEQLHDAFGALTEHPTLSVQADSQLPPGACLIELMLGRLDISLPQQSANVVATLNTLRTGD